MIALAVFVRPGRRGARIAVGGVLATVLALFVPLPARASTVYLLTAGGRVVPHGDPFLTPDPAPPTGSSPSRRPRAGISDRNMRTELARLYHARQLTWRAYRHFLGDWNHALAVEQRLSGTPASELEAVIENLHLIAADGLLIPSRLPVLFETLVRNVQWWTNGRSLSSGDRVQFAGSQLVWEYYAGQGLELQELGSWGQADWMYEAGPAYWPRLRRLVDELIPLGVELGRGVVWEYYFNFGGGTPPWTSAMSQGTAIQALTQTYEATSERRYLQLARRALPVFSEPPPHGVAVGTSRGTRYLLYSFAPDAAVINGFLQSLIGLYDYAKVSNDPLGWRLFRAGDAEARWELPGYDTGAWSLYQPGEEASLDYHQLVTQFLQQLCQRTGARVYCRTAARFQAYLKTPPALRLLTHRAPVARGFTVYFRVSKISRVGITIMRGRRTLFLTSASFPHGVHSFAIPALPAGGRYTVILDATDLAGNYDTNTDTVVAR